MRSAFQSSPRSKQHKASNPLKREVAQRGSIVPPAWGGCLGTAPEHVLDPKQAHCSFGGPLGCKCSFPKPCKALPQHLCLPCKLKGYGTRPRNQSAELWCAAGRTHRHSPTPWHGLPGHSQPSWRLILGQKNTSDGRVKWEAAQFIWQKNKMPCSLLDVF